MLLHYLNLTLRLISRNSFFAAINIFGLAVGFAAFFILWQHSTNELRIDQHHEQIYRLGFKWRWEDNGARDILTFGILKAGVSPRLKNDFPEVESFVRVCEQAGFFQKDLNEAHGLRIVVSRKDQVASESLAFKETRCAYADRNYFDFFKIPILHGDPASMLSGVNFVALSESTAQRYFGDQNPIGQNLSLNDTITLKVTGVYRDLPPSSRFNYDMVISNEGLLEKWSTAPWGGVLSYVRLSRGSSPIAFEDKVNRGREKYFGGMERDCKCRLSIFAQSINEMPFTSGFIGDEEVHQKSRGILHTLAIISVIILSMAWINYINLSITRFATRMKEFAARRVNGATPLDLVKQFVTESLVINTLAICLSLTIVQISREPLALLLNIHIADILSTPMNMWMVLCVAFLFGILATALYPVYVCVSRSPQKLLVKDAQIPGRSFSVSLLATVQFTAAVVLISWIFTMYLQLDFILRRDVGMQRDGVIMIEGPIIKPELYEQKLEELVNQIDGLSHVDGVAYSWFMVGGEGNKPGTVVVPSTGVSHGSDYNAINETFIPLLGIPIVAGRNFRKDDRPDVAMISSQSVVRLGFASAEDALGTKVRLNTGDWGDFKDAEIIGVFADYNFRPYFNYLNSNTMSSGPKRNGVYFTFKNKLFDDLKPDHILIKLTPTTNKAVIGDVENLYKKSFPGNVFSWQFLDDGITHAYENEKILRNQLLIFTIIAIMIACLGLLAMVTQKILEKKKEIGIRKVMGAKAIQIGKILLRPMMGQFILAVSLGIPPAYYLGSEYLQKYSEQINLHWWYLMAPVAGLAMIMLAAISTILISAVRSNPVDCLRHE